MTYTLWGSNSVGQSSVLIKRRSRVQVPPALPLGRGPIGKDAGLLPRRLLVRIQPPQPFTYIEREENVWKKKVE